MKRESESGIPLVVDLDGTLTATDLLVESALRLLRRNPLFVFLLPFWLLRGRQVLKCEIARRVELDAARLPYNEEFLQFLRDEHLAGRRIVLATASTRLLAQKVFDHFAPLFADLMCSDEFVNLKGRRKRDALLERYGAGGFDYAGNDVTDFAVWYSARKAIAVRPSRRVRGAATRLPNFDRIFPRRSSPWYALVRSLRVHQWLKNLLVFVPLVAAHKWGQAVSGLEALVAFVALSLAASGAYQINDILDVDHDRAHPNKRRRPVASGELPILLAACTGIALLFAGLALAFSLSTSVCDVLIGYVVLTFAYSFWLKAQPIIDVVMLACLYTIRIVAGAAAIEVVPSYWLLTFSMFIFLSLAVLKRCAELTASSASGVQRPAGRGYQADDRHMLTSLGTALGASAVMVLALYINADASARNYAQPEILWLLCPVLVYWLGHMWLKTSRGEMHDDPIIFAMRDRPSIAVVFFGVALLLLASF